MRLLITRPEPDAARTAARLEALGHEVVLHPLMAIENLDTKVDLTPYQAVLITSANGVRALAAATQSRTLPLYCVGDASATEARAQGFTKTTAAHGNVETLAKLVAESLDPANGPLIHIAGENRAGDLKAELEAKGFTIERQVLYRATLATEIPANALKNVDGVLLYSPRTARHFAKLVGMAGLAQQCESMVAYGLSQAIGAALSPLSFKAVKIAAQPTEDALFACLPKAAPKGEEREEMADSSGSETPKITAPKVDLNDAPPRPPKKAKSGGSATGRLGWIVALLVLVAVGGAIGWGALYNRLPDETRANLPAFLQASDQAASAAIDEKMAAFDDEVTAVMSRLQQTADRAQEQQAARLATLEAELATLKTVAANNSAALESVRQAVLQLTQQERVQPEDLMRLANQINDLKASTTLQAQNNIETRDIAIQASRDAAAALAAGADAPRRTAFAVALSGLDRAAASGQPYDRELAAAAAQADSQIAALLAPLNAHADQGVATRTMLASRYEALARTAMKVDAVPTDAPWYEKLWARLKAIVTVRPVGEVAGNSTGAIISRAEAQLARGDLESAVTTLTALDNGAALTFDKWLQQANDRLDVDAAIANVALSAQANAMAVSAPDEVEAEPQPESEPESELEESAQ